MKLLIDTNVILDMVLKRSGCDVSMELFRKVKETGTGAYITASSVTEQDIQEAFEKRWKDFEESLVPVMTPAAWIEMIKRT